MEGRGPIWMGGWDETDRRNDVTRDVYLDRDLYIILIKKSYLMPYAVPPVLRKLLSLLLMQPTA